MDSCMKFQRLGEGGKKYREREQREIVQLLHILTNNGVSTDRLWNQMQDLMKEQNAQTYKRCG